MNTTLMKFITSTAWAAELQTCQLKNIPYPMRENTTLNEKLDILAGVAHPSTVYPRAIYVAIGNHGHKSKIGKDGIEITEHYQHKPTDAALYRQMPFVLRQPNNDLTPQERERFGLRKIEEHNGQLFIAYYLRRLETAQVSTQLKYQTITTENKRVKIKVTEFIPDESNLNPVPEPLQAVNVNTLDGEYVVVESMTSFEMDEWDLEEYCNAANIIYGSDRYAIISELALVSGVDRVVETNNGAGSANFNYKEVVCAQVMAFIATEFKAYNHNTLAKLDLNIGASEPMYKLVAP